MLSFILFFFIINMEYPYFLFLFFVPDALENECQHSSYIYYYYYTCGTCCELSSSSVDLVNVVLSFVERPVHVVH